MPIETFNISFESTQKKQYCGTKITCTEVRNAMVITKNVFLFVVVLMYSLQLLWFDKTYLDLT